MNKTMSGENDFIQGAKNTKAKLVTFFSFIVIGGFFGFIYILFRAGRIDNASIIGLTIPVSLIILAFLWVKKTSTRVKEVEYV